MGFFFYREETKQSKIATIEEKKVARAKRQQWRKKESTRGKTVDGTRKVVFFLRKKLLPGSGEKLLRGSVVREPNPAHGTRNGVLIFHALTLSRTLRGRAGGSGLTLRLSLDRPRPERARAPACALWRSPAPCAGGRAAQSCLHAYHSTDREPSAHGRQPVRFGALPRLARESAWPGAASAPITRSTQIRARPVDIQATIAPTSGLMRMWRAVCWRCRGCLCAYRSTDSGPTPRAHGRQPRARKCSLGPPPRLSLDRDCSRP